MEKLISVLLVASLWIVGGLFFSLAAYFIYCKLFELSSTTDWRDNRLNPSSLFFHICRWYFRKIKRIEAEKKLLLPENEHGAFLIRDSESRQNDFSLSGRTKRYNFMTWQTLLILHVKRCLIILPVRDGDTVKHYRIRQLDEGGFFIARRTTFRFVEE